MRHLLAGICAATFGTLSLVTSATAAPSLTTYPAGTANGGPAALAADRGGPLWFVQYEDPGRVARRGPDGSVQEWGEAQGIPKDKQPTGIALDDQGNAWFTLSGGDQIGRISASTGTVQLFTPPSGGSKPWDIVRGPDDAMWFTERGSDKVGRVTAAGLITEIALPGGAAPEGLTVGPDGAIWVAETGRDRLARVPIGGGPVTEHGTGMTAGGPKAVATGADGALWFTQFSGAGAIGRYRPGDVSVTNFTSGLTASGQPRDITAGGDGALWFTESNSPGAIGRITLTGDVTLIRNGLQSSPEPWGIATGPDGNVWFADHRNPGAIGRVTLPPSLADAGNATAVTHDTATLSAAARANAQWTVGHFEWGETAAYGTNTILTLLGNGTQPDTLSAGLTGLEPATTYHYRLVAENDTGVTTGPGRTFTTAAAPTPAAPAPLTLSSPATPATGSPQGAQPADTAPDPRAGPAGQSRPAAQQGRTVVVEGSAGTVLVKPRGAKRFAALAQTEAIPLGSLVDTRSGEASLTLAVPGGTQDGSFTGGIFEVRQKPGGDGTTDIILRGSSAPCRNPGARAAAKTSKGKKQPKRPQLWAKDDHGRFRTHGRNSVATVRGTRWLTQETCAGTLTRVLEGVVEVRPKHGRKRVVVLRAGQSFTARPRR